SFLTSLLYSISNFQGAFLFDHRIAATSNNIARPKIERNPFFIKIFFSQIKPCSCYVSLSAPLLLIKLAWQGSSKYNIC
ncbi:hypothetical protein, partial [Laceyella tengchongensis]|uniref:hypothetical protein n=1 Tax=Laceyella tengchongensis TaxID=574699 RepID=UPI001E505A03